MSEAWMLTIYCALVLLASLAGGWLLLFVPLTHTRLQLAISLVAGLMLGIALLHFLPDADRQLRSLDETVAWMLGGFLAIFFIQRFFHFHHHDLPEGEPEEHSQHGPPHEHHHEELAGAQASQSAGQLSWIATTVGMTLHSLIGGVALAAAVSAEPGHGPVGWLGLGTALVIILHKPFDAMAVATLMAASGCTRFARHVINLLFSLVTPLGAVSFAAGVNWFAAGNPIVLGDGMAFCAGTFLCIASSDLLPELQFHSHDRLKLSVALLVGLSIAVLIKLLGD
jgi:zinc and cadmium transporter